ncbi:MAG: flagellar hook-associated family protein [Hyphomicrobiales bacterium]|nr:flagellar hook-associated family protein [Hyphomicrobiales bacterium]
MTYFVSTKTVSEASRFSLMSLQTRLADGQKELTTGRLIDVGESLGYETGKTVSLRQEFERLTQITETNVLVATRLAASQAAIKQMAGNAQSFLDSLTGARESASAKATVAAAAKAGLAALTDMLNTTAGGEYVFAGINTDMKPVAEYVASPASAASTSVAAAFLAEFGFAQSDPAVSNISSADMEAFLGGGFDGLFGAASWSADWSSASDSNIRSRISTYELIDTSANANEQAFRDLAQAYTMVADLNVETLNQNTYEAVLNAASKILGKAAQGIGDIQSRLGIAQQRVSNADERMALQVNILTEHINGLETVDPYEASTKVSALITQIETAYALTARVQRLSLLNYL